MKVIPTDRDWIYQLYVKEHMETQTKMIVNKANIIFINKQTESLNGSKKR